MKWVDDIILGLLDLYNTNNPYDLCDLLDIEVIEVDSSSAILSNNNSLYIRNYRGSEVIFIKTDLSNKIKNFYLSHELGHAILHPNIKNSLNSQLINIGKIEKQANYFAFKLTQIEFDEFELQDFTIQQIASCLEVPLKALKQLANI